MRVRPSQQFVADVKQLLKDIEEYKGFARSGQDSVRMYRVFSEVVDFIYVIEYSVALCCGAVDALLSNQIGKQHILG